MSAVKNEFEKIREELRRFADEQCRDDASPLTSRLRDKELIGAIAVVYREDDALPRAKRVETFLRRLDQAMRGQSALARLAKVRRWKADLDAAAESVKAEAEVERQHRRN